MWLLFLTVLVCFIVSALALHWGVVLLVQSYTKYKLRKCGFNICSLCEFREQCIIDRSNETNFYCDHQ